MPSRRAPREPWGAEGLPCPAGPRPSLLPAPALRQVTHQDAHHVGPELGERLRHAGGRLGLRRGLRLRSRAGCSRVLHGCVPHAGRASRGWGALAPQQRALGSPRRVPARCVTEPRPRATSPPAAPATPRGPLAGARTPDSRWRRAARLTSPETFPPGLRTATG